MQIAHPSNKLWLLPLLKKFVRGAPLAYFVRTLLPLADRMQQGALAADARGLAVEAKNLMHANRQVWGLLKAAYTSSLRTHTLVASGRIH